MNVSVRHSLPGRIRLSYNKFEYTCKQALLAQTLIAVQEGILDTNCNSNVGSFLILYDVKKISQEEILNLFSALTEKYLENEELLKSVEQIPETESIEGIFIETLAIHFLKKLLLPAPIRVFFIWMSVLNRIFGTLEKFAKTGKFFSTELLDTTAITVATLSGNSNTASQINLLLNMGEAVEEVTKRNSYGNLAHTLLSMNETVQVVNENEEKSIPLSALQKGDIVVVRQNSLIPADGQIQKGEGMVNQSSITGESLPVEKKSGDSVFAGTVLEEGEIYIKVIQIGKETKVQNIINMIDNSQNLKALAQQRSEMLAEKIVPFNFLLTGLTWFLTRSITKTMATLMVDYSCAMKLSAPIAVLSAMKESATIGITVKGGKYLEEVALADIVVFDKTGTLTFANPTLEKIYAMKGFSEDEVLKMAACLEEHYPHPLGRAVIKAAESRNLVHPENHTKVEYIVAHGIASILDEKKIRIGSFHFIFEDEKIPRPRNLKKIQTEAGNDGYSFLYLSYDGKLAGILCIGDPARPNSKETIKKLHNLGIKKCVMITGDTEGAAKKIAEECGIDEWISQALPEDKVNYIEKQKSLGHKVIMLGDGINDAPALSCADVGIAVDGSSSIASDTADIELQKNGLESLVTVRKLGLGLLEKINSNNSTIVGVNSILMILGMFGVISPQIAAILHNGTTLGMTLNSMQPILENKTDGEYK